MQFSCLTWRQVETALVKFFRAEGGEVLADGGESYLVVDDGGRISLSDLARDLMDFSGAPRPASRAGSENTETPRLVRVMSGGACAGFLITRGARGVEAFDKDEKSLGVFPDVIGAATAVEKSAAPDAAGGRL